jgi:hypothetical protein
MSPSRIPAAIAAILVSSTFMTAAIADDFAISRRNPQGPSSSESPYLVPAASGVAAASILTTGDGVNGYRMAGIPDGLGAFDNRDGTFTLVMNHELGNTLGAIRAHGAKGAFVSKWVIEKESLRVVSGEDLAHQVHGWTATGWSPITKAYSRFCSADLPAVSAFYDRRSGLGTRERIFMNGEESGVEGTALAHVITGAQAGHSYELPWLGHFAWENSVAKPGVGRKTVVAGTDDGQGGQVYFYVGMKTSSANVVEAAGLTNGRLYGVKIDGLGAETDATVIAPGTRFTLVDQGDVSALTGAQLDNLSRSGTTVAGSPSTYPVSTLQRPEDASWDPSDARNFYFATTASFNGVTRVWKLRFDDADDVTRGGVVSLALEGTPALVGVANELQAGPRMIDNITVSRKGQLLLQEDVGNNAYLGGIFQLDPRSAELRKVFTMDPVRFVTGGADFRTIDEESSGVIPAPFLGGNVYLAVVQNHKASTDVELVEGGQLLALRVPALGGDDHDDEVEDSDDDR